MIISCCFIWIAWRMSVHPSGFLLQSNTSPPQFFVRIVIMALTGDELKS